MIYNSTHYLPFTLLIRTRATNLYQDGIELELVSRILGYFQPKRRVFTLPHPFQWWRKLWKK